MIAAATIGTTSVFDVMTTMKKKAPGLVGVVDPPWVRGTSVTTSPPKTGTPRKAPVVEALRREIDDIKLLTIEVILVTALVCRLATHYLGVALPQTPVALATTLRHLKIVCRVVMTHLEVALIHPKT